MKQDGILFKGRETPSTVELDELFFENVPEGSKVLDFGCAWGRIAFHLQKNGYTVTGFDLNDNAIASANETARKTNVVHDERVKFQTANATELPFPDESFDACIIQAFLTTIIQPEDRKKDIIRGLQGTEGRRNFIPCRFRAELGKPPIQE